jgi:hypothetical protein
MSSASGIRRPPTFEPEKFEATARIDLINLTRAGKPTTAKVRPDAGNVGGALRRVALATHGIECSCPSITNLAEAEHDRRRPSKC